LSHEIETCKREITRLEDQQLELMEQADAGHRLVRRPQNRPPDSPRGERFWPIWHNVSRPCKSSDPSFGRDARACRRG
jgi:hypothetical protein